MAGRHRRDNESVVADDQNGSQGGRQVTDDVSDAGDSDGEQQDHPTSTGRTYS